MPRQKFSINVFTFFSSLSSSTYKEYCATPFREVRNCTAVPLQSRFSRSPPFCFSRANKSVTTFNISLFMAIALAKRRSLCFRSSKKNLSRLEYTFFTSSLLYNSTVLAAIKSNFCLNSMI